MGATNSVDFIPQRHVHISCYSSEDFLIKNLKAKLESHNLLVTNTEKYRPDIIDKAEFILFCLTKNTMRTTIQPSELYHCLKQHKYILFLYMDHELENMYRTYTTHHDSIYFMELTHIRNIENYFLRHFCDISSC